MDPGRMRRGGSGADGPTDLLVVSTRAVLRVLHIDPCGKGKPMESEGQSNVNVGPGVWAQGEDWAGEDYAVLDKSGTGGEKPWDSASPLSL